MKAYHTPGYATVGTDKTATTVLAGTTVRPHIYEIQIGSAATPGDQATKWAAQRLTADGTGTSFTPVPLVSADPAAIATSKVNYSAEPTYTANAIVWQQSIHQRTAYRWFAYEGRELVVPASANAGIGVKSLSSTATPVTDVCVFWRE